MIKLNKGGKTILNEDKEKNPFSELVSAKEMMFCIEYVSNGYNMYRAALKAGYSKSYAKSKSYQLMEKVGIKRLINKLIKERAEKVFNSSIADVKELMEFWTSIVRGTIENPNAIDYKEYVQEEQKQLSFFNDENSSNTYSSENKKIPLGKRMEASKLLYDAQAGNPSSSGDTNIVIDFTGD